MSGEKTGVFEWGNGVLSGKMGVYEPGENDKGRIETCASIRISTMLFAEAQRTIERPALKSNSLLAEPLSTAGSLSISLVSLVSCAVSFETSACSQSLYH